MNSIIFMEPIYKDYIWGGNKLKTKLNKNTPYDKTAESWEISANKNGNCHILNEEYKNKTLNDLFNDQELKDKLFGTKCKDMKDFPILIKYIDAKEDLSIQVHPDDNYAYEIGEKHGKNELWYVMDCEDNSKIINGFKNDIVHSELKKSIEDNTIKNYLNYSRIKKGDSIYIEAGTVHAILKNNLICEIQQNSDITYRVYDWDRVDKNGEKRLLHKKEALDVIKTHLKSCIKNSHNNELIQNLVKNEYFVTDKINCNNKFKDISNKETFYAINVVKGEGILKFSNKEIKIKLGDSFIIPATLGEYEILGKIEILKSYVS